MIADQLFGRYVGTVRTAGLRWVNLFARRQKVSTRIRNHESEVLKVNDFDGNPIEIAAVVVWQVEDTARAVFEVDSFVEASCRGAEPDRRGCGRSGRSSTSTRSARPRW